METERSRPTQQRAFLALIRDGDRDRWSLDVEPRVCGGSGFLHGGCALGAMAQAMEEATGRTLSWATAQYVSRVPMGERVVVEVTVDAVGRAMTQAGATVRFGDQLIARAVASLGRRPLPVEHQWVQPPVVADPADCAQSDQVGDLSGSFTDTVDIRVAASSPGSATTSFWCRLDHGAHGTTPLLAALGDLLPSGMRVALRADLRGASLDNSVRIVAEDPSTPWLLVEVRSESFHEGIGVGQVRMFTSSGRLLAIADQSFAVSEMTPTEPAKEVRR